MARALRKSDLNEGHYDLITRAAGMGMTQEDISYLLGANFETFRKWLKNDSLVKSVYDKGKAQAKFDVASRLMDKIKEGDVACILFYLKCQCGWKENKETAAILSKPIIYLPQKNDS